VRRVWPWGVVGLVVGLAVGVVIGWQARNWEWRWGSAAEWAAALGSVAVIAVTLGLCTLRDCAPGVQHEHRWETLRNTAEYGPLRPGVELRVRLDFDLQGLKSAVHAGFIHAEGRRWWRQGSNVWRY
jgi:hypothetical protein